MADSRAIDTALYDVLSNDGPLAALCPDGVWWDVAPEKGLRFVLLTVADADDEPMFNGRAWEDILYLVKVVVLQAVPNASDIAGDAAERLDELLDGGTLTVPGYSTMIMQREKRARLTEISEANPSIKWFHRGGWYRVVMST
jgi:hypothetical protein